MSALVSDVPAAVVSAGMPAAVLSVVSPDIDVVSPAWTSPCAPTLSVLMVASAAVVSCWTKLVSVSAGV